MVAIDISIYIYIYIYGYNLFVILDDGVVCGRNNVYRYLALSIVCPLEWIMYCPMGTNYKSTTSSSSFFNCCYFTTVVFALGTACVQYLIKFESTESSLFVVYVYTILCTVPTINHRLYGRTVKMVHQWLPVVASLLLPLSAVVDCCIGDGVDVYIVTIRIDWYVDDDDWFCRERYE